jgi:ribosomal protein S18 acetylase RimI-like enzyme
LSMISARSSKSLKGKNLGAQNVTSNMPAEVREFEKKDLEDVARLVQSFWALNTEFEPSIELHENALELIKTDLMNYVGSEDQIILVSQSELGLIGMIRVELKHGTFRTPRQWGNIVEFYVLPRARRRSIAKSLLDEALQRIGKKGIEIITAEFPTENVPAANFYERNGFRPIHSVYVRELS